jgi:hypothetical protein
MHLVFLRIHVRKGLLFHSLFHHLFDATFWASHSFWYVYYLCDFLNELLVLTIGANVSVFTNIRDILNVVWTREITFYHCVCITTRYPFLQNVSSSFLSVDTKVRTGCFLVNDSICHLIENVNRTYRSTSMACMLFQHGKGILLLVLPLFHNLITILGVVVWHFIFNQITKLNFLHC